MNLNQVLRDLQPGIAGWINNFIWNGYSWKTPDGGDAIRITALVAVARGQILCVPQGSYPNDRVIPVPISGGALAMPIGVAYNDAANEQPVWVVYSGRALVLPVSTVTPSRGYVAYTSTAEEGRAAVSATIGTTTDQQQVGHFLATGTGAGVLTAAMIHF